VTLIFNGFLTKPLWEDLLGLFINIPEEIIRNNQYPLHKKITTIASLVAFGCQGVLFDQKLFIALSLT
jgi:hypothetical protein